MSTPGGPTVPHLDDDLRSFLIREMGIEFPQPPEDVRVRVSAPVMVYLQAIRLLSIDALGAYCLAEPRSRTGGGVDADWLRVHFGHDDARTQSAIAELFAVGLFLTREQVEQRSREWEAYMDIQNTKKSARKMVAPNPWPQYGKKSWSGTRADLTGWPPEGTAVVYFLRDEVDKLIYVGSSSNVTQRFMSHWDKPWVSYKARECSDREAAYWLEAAEIIRRRPPLNKDYNVGGRGPLVPAQHRRRGKAVA